MPHRRVIDRDGRAAASGVSPGHATALPRMIGLSVAVGRFVEALFWAIFRVAGTVAAAVLLGVAALVVAGVFIRRWRRHRRSR